jgi:Fe2+ transport system protein FeoA
LCYQLLSVSVDGDELFSYAAVFAIVRGMCMTTLKDCPARTRAAIRSIHADQRTALHFREMGLRENDIVYVMLKTQFGGCVVAKDSERLAIDGQTAERIEVRTLS